MVTPYFYFDFFYIYQNLIANSLKNHKRALRRFHKERIQKKRKQYLIFESPNDLESNEIRLKKALKTPTVCSCWMCGNPRKYFGEKTRQEIIFEEIFKSYQNDSVS